MSFFEECLTLGQWLDQDLRRALYKFLLINKKSLYKSDAEKLLVNGSLNSFVANGEIFYFIDRKILKYKTRANTNSEYIDVLRELKLSKFKLINKSKIRKFFAQCEVDVIHNFPVPGENIQEERSYSYNTYPYYDLNYYSNGNGKIRGLINKLKTDDSELLRKLAA
jgi:hypothetical protein